MIKTEDIDYIKQVRERSQKHAEEYKSALKRKRKHQKDVRLASCRAVSNDKRIPLTDEQEVAVSKALSGTQSLKIEAFAGAGKTTTLKAIAQQMLQVAPKRKILYLAFNKSIAEEAAEKFPANVVCRTAHALAFKEVGRHYADRVDRNLSGRKLLYALPHFDTSKHPDNKLDIAGNLIMSTINAFCHSSSFEISAEHVSQSLVRTTLETQDNYCESDVERITEWSVKQGRLAFNAMRRQGGSVPITDDVYLKLWQLSDPELPFDTILYDEAQDASAAMLDAVSIQRSCQKILVGDRFQQIYAWRGAVNAMQSFTAEDRCKISQSFRFGPQIAALANKVISNHLSVNIPIKGNKNIESAIISSPYKRYFPDAILCRTNFEVLNQGLKACKSYKEVAVQGGCAEIIRFVEGLAELQEHKRSSLPELAYFRSLDSWIEYANSDTGSAFKPLSRMVEQYGVSKLKNNLYAMHKMPISDAQCVLCTVHKAKGMEWPHVRLANDFRAPDAENYTQEDTNLLYVALTRAQGLLHVTGGANAAAFWQRPIEKELEPGSAQAPGPR